MYSYNTLNEVSNALKSILNSNESMDIKFVFKCKKTLKLINDEMSIIQDSFPEAPPEYTKYKEELFALYVSHGAKTKQLNNGMQMIESTEGINAREFLPELEKLNEKYSETISEFTEAETKKKEAMEEKVSNIELPKLPLSLFPSKINPNDLSDILLELIEE